MSIPSFRRKTAPRLGGDRIRSHEAPRGSRHQRGYDAEWVDLRDDYRREIKGLCEECARRGYLKHCDVIDHIIPVADAPELRLKRENLQGLCHSHHNGWKRLMETFARKTGATSLLIQWCKHPETRPRQFQIVKFGPLKDLLDADQREDRAAG